MSEKYKNKYRIPSARAAWWNYSWPGAYFITICTRNRNHYFGEIQDGQMILSNCGILADVFWHEIPNHAKNVELGAFVVMPNHLHGILILNGDGGTGGTGSMVETRHALSLQPQPPQPPTQQPPYGRNIAHERFQNQGKNSISSMVGSFKSAVTKHANRLEIEFGWQSRFHDHLIRDDAEYQRINDYIENNPMNWKEDRFFK
jgi:REP element-mobilizing transposase RayT